MSRPWSASVRIERQVLSAFRGDLALHATGGECDASALRYNGKHMRKILSFLSASSLSVLSPSKGQLLLELLHLLDVLTERRVALAEADECLPLVITV